MVKQSSRTSSLIVFGRILNLQSRGGTRNVRLYSSIEAEFGLCLTNYIVQDESRLYSSLSETACLVV